MFWKCKHQLPNGLRSGRYGRGGERWVCTDGGKAPMALHSINRSSHSKQLYNAMPAMCTKTSYLCVQEFQLQLKKTHRIVFRIKSWWCIMLFLRGALKWIKASVKCFIIGYFVTLIQAIMNISLFVLLLLVVIFRSSFTWTWVKCLATTLPTSVPLSIYL